MALIHAFQPTISPNLLAMVQTVHQIDATADTSSLKVKDAGRLTSMGVSCGCGYLLFSWLVYKAAGLCAFELYDDLDYDSWYQTQLLKELEVHDPRLVLNHHLL